MKREKALDVVRVIAMLMIVNFHFAGAVGKVDWLMYGHANGGWGSVGTGIFFILSGYVLRLSNQTVEQVGVFYKKRFLSLYPLFYLIWLASAAWILITDGIGGFPAAGAPWRIIFTVLGIDNYMGYLGIPTYYYGVGEWYSTILILLYLLYPLLNRGFEKKRGLVTALIVSLYLGNLIFTPWGIVADAGLPTGLLLFWIGMNLERTREWLIGHKWVAIPALAAAAVIGLIPLPGYQLPWKNLLSVSLFILMYIAANLFPEKVRGSKIIGELSKISYSVYLCHHFILIKAMERLGAYLTTTERIVGAYCLYFVITLTAAWLFNEVNSRYLRKIAKK